MKLTKEQLTDILEQTLDLDLDKNESLSDSEHAVYAKLLQKIEKTKNTVFAECCTECGFPIDIKRKPNIFNNDIFSHSMHLTNECKTCGCQKDGSTIPIVYEKRQELLTKSTKERKKLIDFFKHFHFLTKEERKEVAVTLYESEDSPNEPFSWNIVWEEIINDTERSNRMLNNIDF